MEEMKGAAAGRGRILQSLLDAKRKKERKKDDDDDDHHRALVLFESLADDHDLLLLLLLLHIMIIIRQMKSALIEIDEALLRLLFLWRLGWGLRQADEIKPQPKRGRRRRRRRTTKTKQNKNKKWSRRGKREKRNQLSKAKQSRAQLCNVPCFFCMSVCVSVSVCVFCQIPSLRARAMGA